jgi:ketosteroid isomerase-like protein
MKFYSVLPAILILAAAGCAQPEAPSAPEPAPVDQKPALVEVAERFSAAVATNDSTMAASVLSEDVKIVEGGSIETRDSYLSGHFHGDAAFIGAVTRDQVSRDVTVLGDAAWMVSKSRLQGTFRDREIDINSLETLVLTRGDSGWKIVSIHWSSGSSH